MCVTHCNAGKLRDNSSVSRQKNRRSYWIGLDNEVLLVVLCTFQACIGPCSVVFHCRTPSLRAVCFVQAVVFSEGVLFLDDCDFKGSSAAILVNSGNEATTVIRNALLSSENCESAVAINMFG